MARSTRGGRPTRQSPLAVARTALERGRRFEADLEVYVQFGRTVTIKVFGGEVESVTVAEPRGLGVRAIREGRTGYAFTTDIRARGLDRVLAQACGALEAADPDPHAGLAGPPAGGYLSLPGLWRPGVPSMPLEQKIRLALRAEAAALGVRGVHTVEESVYADEEARIGIVSSSGIEAEDEQTYCYAYVFAHAGEEGDRQSGLGYSAGREPETLDAEQAGRDAAAKALALVGARPCRTGSYTVVFDREVTAGLISSLAQALSAEAVQKGRSVLAGKLGDEVASPVLTLLDDGLAPEGMATASFDGEGTPHRITRLIDGGVLRSYLYDSRSARREGGTALSTGNGVRESYRSLPHVGPSNLVIVPGVGSLDEVVARVGDGLYVEGVAGLHSGVNPVSGEISVGATGRLIEGGSLGAPVREVTIATDFLRLLKGVKEVGGDSRWVPFYGSVSAPALVVENIAVSGSAG